MRVRRHPEAPEMQSVDQLKGMLRARNILRYYGKSDEVACFVAGIPLSRRHRYYEVTITGTGVRGMIAVGLVNEPYNLDHQPGWLPNSVAFHADDGKLYNGSTVGQEFGPKCSRGDRIGCGISRDSDDGELTVFFTKNGKEIGSVEFPASPALYPAVGMRSLGEEVQLNLKAEWMEELVGKMIVDGPEEDWDRLHFVKMTGTLLEYMGEEKSRGLRAIVGLAQARQPLNTRFHYYELEITDAGENCYIALGLACRGYPEDRHPGWSKGSIAYHADDGNLFQGSGVGDQFGPRCFEGDIMGCGIMFPRDYSLDSGDDVDDWDLELSPTPSGVRNDLYRSSDDEQDKREDLEKRKVMVFFTRNRNVVGRREMVLPVGGLYPTIGMMSTGEKVRVNLHPLSG